MAFEVDNTTLVLLGVFAALLLYHRFFSTPLPLVHPLLLGKQSDVSAVRRKGESGIYRSFATGQGSPFTVRPANTLKTVKNIAHDPKELVTLVGKQPDQPVGSEQRSILDVPLTDDSLAEVLRLVPLGLRALFPSLKEPSSIVTLLPPSTSTTFPLLLLQLASPVPLVVLPSPSFITDALTSTETPPPAVIVTHVGILGELVEQAWEDTQGKTSVLVIGDPDKTSHSVVKAAGAKGLSIKYWEEIWEVAETVTNDTIPEPVYSDVHSYFYSTSPNGETAITKVTQINITAGIAGYLSVFPANKRPSRGDVAASSVRLDTPFGMVIALGSIWNGSGFRFISRATPIWPGEGSSFDPAAELAGLAIDVEGAQAPTVLFISRDHHEALVRALYNSFNSSSLGSFGAAHKIAGIKGGDVSRRGWLEKLVWRPVRSRPLGGIAGDKLRSIIVVGDAPAANLLWLSHLLLSIPIGRVRSSPFSAGPIFASHFSDLQCSIPDSLTPSFEGQQAHTGPPASNVEVVLKGPEIDKQIGTDAALEGRVFIRGPAVLERVGQSTPEGWVDIGEDAGVQTNGTFVFA